MDKDTPNLRPVYEQVYDWAKSVGEVNGHPNPVEFAHKFAQAILMDCAWRMFVENQKKDAPDA